MQGSRVNLKHGLNRAKRNRRQRTAHPPSLIHRGQPQQGRSGSKGFTADAQRYALAHQISLIDLQGPAFEDLRAVTAGATRRLLDLAERSGVPAFPLWQARAALRHALGTWTAEDRSPDATHGTPLSDAITIEEMSAGQPLQLPAGSLTRIAESLGADLVDQLMLGFPQGPFVLVLQPDDPDAFSSFLRNSGSDVPVRIRYASSGDGTSGEWAIVPVHGHDDLIVRFGIPPLLDSWLLAAGEAELERARLAKKTLFSTIAVFHHGNRMTRLRYEKAERRDPADQVCQRS